MQGLIAASPSNGLPAFPPAAARARTAKAAFDKKRTVATV